VGKTTLALEIAKRRDSIYLDLENPRDKQKLSDPEHYLSLHSDRLVVLDEIQCFPDLFMSLRGLIDTGRREGKATARFLVLGSASNALLKQSSESLAGRISYLQLPGLTPLEIGGQDQNDLRKLWLRGGFPNSFCALDDDASDLWRGDFITTYLERDIPQLGPRIPATTLRRFWMMLAHVHGELLHAAKLACALGVTSVTIARYLDLMSDLLLIRRLNPWHGNIKKRLVKSPKVYVRDAGIVHHLLQIRDYEQLLAHPVYGKSWEGFVIENILAILPPYIQPFFYRTAAGAEIDLLLEFGPKNYWAIEIKATQTPRIAKGFYIACQDLMIAKRWVIYTGKDTFSLGRDTTVIGLIEFMQHLKSSIK
jgi:predicted AAA+ superfamily ATPase